MRQLVSFAILTKQIQWGVQSLDEMGIVALRMATVRKEDELVWQETMGAILKAAVAQAAKDGTIKRYLEQFQRARDAARR